MTDPKHCVDNIENAEAVDIQLRGRWSSGEGTVSVFSDMNQAHKPVVLGFLTCAVVVRSHAIFVAFLAHT